MSTTSRRKLSPAQRRLVCFAVVLAVAVGAWQVAGGLQARGTPAGTGVTRYPYLQSLTRSSVYIVWETATPTASRVEYQDTAQPRLPWRKAGDGNPVRHHEVQLTGLAPSFYNYRVSTAGADMVGATFGVARQPGTAFSFAVWGDSGEGTANQRRLAERIDAARPDFMLHTGDLIYDRGEAAGFNPRFFEIYAPTLARAPFYGSLGNHDIKTENGRPFLENFIFPRNGPAGVEAERNYSFDYGDAHCAVIDSNLSEDELRDKIAPWLERDLKGSTARWKFAAFHHPPYSSGAHGDTPRTQRVLAPVFSRCKVDVVFNGHDHTYERFKPINGVVYIVTGAGGAGRYKRHEYRDTTACFYNDDWSFTRIDINGNTLRGQQITTTGAVVDDWTISRP